MNVAMNVVFIGGGNMADALIGGMLKSGFAPGQLRAVEVDGAARRRLADKYRIECCDEPRKALRPGDVVVFAVKPQQMKEAARFSGLKDNAHLVISIAAGITLDTLSRWLGGYARMVRAMPNTPALIGAGAAAISPGSDAGEEDLAWAEAILGAVGVVVRVPEKALDAVTGLSGSGPAYVFLVAEAMADAGVLAGLPRDVAETLAFQTLLGTARLLDGAADGPAALRAAVTSPGGTTAAALSVLMGEGGLQPLLIRAVEAAKKRSVELG